jgi:hypothetical protein
VTIGGALVDLGQALPGAVVAFLTIEQTINHPLRLTAGSWVVDRDKRRSRLGGHDRGFGDGDAVVNSCQRPPALTRFGAPMTLVQDCS